MISRPPPVGPSFRRRPAGRLHDERVSHSTLSSGFVHGHAQLRDELAVRPAAARRPVVRRTSPMPARSSWRPISRPTQVSGSLRQKAMTRSAYRNVRSRSSSAMCSCRSISAGAMPRLELSLRIHLPKSPNYQLPSKFHPTSPIASVLHPWLSSSFAPTLSCAVATGLFGQPVLVDAGALPGCRSACRPACRLRPRLCGRPDRPAAWSRPSVICRSFEVAEAVSGPPIAEAECSLCYNRRI